MMASKNILADNLGHLILYRGRICLLPALSHNGSVTWELCSPPAMPCSLWWMHWSEPLFSLLMQRGSDELFSSCISNGPYIMNSGRGLPWRVNPLYGSACLVWFVCVAMTINLLFKSQSLLFLLWLYLCLSFFFFSMQLMATTQKNSKVTSAVLVFHHVWSTYASYPTT